MRRVEFYFDFSCPYAYLGSTQIEAVAARTNAELVWRPMLLGGVFRTVKTPDVPAAHMPAAKARHNAQDMFRWADVFDVPLVMPPAHPMRTVRALRALLTLPEPSWPPVIHALFGRYWALGQDVTRPESVREVLASAGVAEADVVRALAGNDDADVRDELRRRTERAIARGVFGAPTMFINDGEVDPPLYFWGQDRLHLVERALAGWRPRLGDPDAPLV